MSDRGIAVVSRLSTFVAFCAFVAGLLVVWGGQSRETYAGGDPHEEAAVGRTEEDSRDVRSLGDPFSLPPGVRRKTGEEDAEEGGEDPGVSSLQVTAILTQGSRRVAAVGRKIVCEGDWIGDEEVLRIEADRVVLRRSGQVREVLLRRSTIPLTVETSRVRR
jgi:hypothetical protein